MSVSAINKTTIEVTFKGAVSKELDFSNFVIDGGLAITDAKISGNKATLTTSSDLIRNKEYTVSIFGVKDAEGNEVVTSGKFVWEVAEGTVVALDSTTLSKGEKTGLSVKDAGGKVVKDATVEVISMNTNLVTVTGGAAGSAPNGVVITAVEAGTVDVKVITTLPTGEKLTNTFKVTVKAEDVKPVNAGFTLLTKNTDMATTLTNEDADFRLANTRSFKDFALKTTKVQLAASGPQDTYYVVPFDEVTGNPKEGYVDFKDADRVTIPNALVGAVDLAGKGTAGAEVEFTPIAAGKTNVNVFFKDGTTKSYPIEVVAAPQIKAIQVDATQIDLSDEHVLASDDDTFINSQEGVDAKIVTIDALDQFNEKIDFESDSKVVIASSTEGISVFTGSTYTDPITTTGLTGIAAGPLNFAVVAQKDEPMKNAKVTVSYFKNSTDAKPTTVKTITVNVADIKTDAVVTDIDVNTVSEIDANYAATLAVDYEGIDFTSTAVVSNKAGAKIFSLDKNGNRLEFLNIDSSAVGTNNVEATVDANNKEALKYVKESATKAGIELDTTVDALTYLRADNKVDVTVSAKGVTKVLPITYKNTANVPNKATVATNTIAVKGKAADLVGLTLEDIIFGQLDTSQLVTDNAAANGKLDILGTNVVSVLKNAKNNGYKFNQSLITITGTNGKIMPIGAAVYGTNTVTNVFGKANTWTNSIVDGFNSTPFAANKFDVEFALANILTTGNAAVTNTSDLEDGITIVAGESASFTLVISGIYTDGSVVAIEAGTSAAEKAKHNLLAAPVQLNVSVTAE